MPRPAYVSYRHPNHETYRATERFAAPGLYRYLRGVEASPFVTSDAGLFGSSNAYTGRMSSYASNASNSPAGEVCVLEFRIAGYPLGSQVVGVRCSYSLEEIEPPAAAEVTIRYASAAAITNATFPLDVTGPNRVQRNIFFLPGTEVDFLNTATLTFRAAAGLNTARYRLKLYQFEPVVVHAAIAERVAQSHIRMPSFNPQQITIYGRFEPPAYKINDLPAAALHYAITREEGVVTTVRLEQALPAEEAAQRALLDRRDRQGTLDAAAASR